jgi:putative flippase GtrA
MKQPLRFLAVSVLGLVLDIGLAWGLAAWFGLPLWLAGLCGFVAAAAMNYLLHEFWTFRDGQVRATSTRFGRHLLSLGATLAVRLGAIVALQSLFGAESRALVVLIPAVGLSFCASFLLARFWVFVPQSTVNGGPDGTK